MVTPDTNGGPHMPEPRRPDVLDYESPKPKRGTRWPLLVALVVAVIVILLLATIA